MAINIEQLTSAFKVGDVNGNGDWFQIGIDGSLSRYELSAAAPIIPEYTTNISTLSASVNSIDAEVIYLSGAIDGNTATIGVNTVDILALSGAISADAIDVTELSAAIDTNTTYISELSGAIDTNAIDITALSASVDLKADINIE